MNFAGLTSQLMERLLVKGPPRDEYDKMKAEVRVINGRLHAVCGGLLAKSALEVQGWTSGEFALRFHCGRSTISDVGAKETSEAWRMLNKWNG